ncbi:MAG: hypothetical protein JRG87_13650 [Deltaproteobacteria bacterium]|nr:hypothetical protein [Deltaproteobacteria bacterium]
MGSNTIPAGGAVVYRHSRGRPPGIHLLTRFTQPGRRNLSVFEQSHSHHPLLSPPPAVIAPLQKRLSNRRTD